MTKPARRHALAMIGGAPTSLIGPMHRLAAKLGANLDLVAGVFSADRDRSLAAADDYGIDRERCYASPAALFAGEAGRSDGIDIVVIATPNHLHLPAALAAIAAGVHVVSDKPITATLAEAHALEAALAGACSTYAVTYTYTGFPMVREARARVAVGRIGRVRKVIATYLQGWLAGPAAALPGGGAAWRTDPARSGTGGTSADIGTHAFNLIEYVAGEKAVAILADARALGEGRRLDDDCNALLRLAGGGAATLVASQAAWGEGNALSIAVYGEHGALRWSYDRPDELTVVDADRRTEVIGPGSPGRLVADRLPLGLGGGIVPPLSLIYRDVVAAIDGRAGMIGGVVPGIAEGVRGMRFVDAVVAAPGDWVALG